MINREERLLQIVELIRVEGGIQSKALASRFGVSAVTIRKDLDELVERGLAIRGLGEVLPATSNHLEQAFQIRSRLNIQAKMEIGKTAAGLIKPGESVILDAGSTAMEIARNIRVQPLTLITPALNVALAAGALPGVTVILPGPGALDPIALSLDGPEIVESFAHLRVDKYFLALRGIDLEFGLTDTEIRRIRLKQAMMSAAQEVIVVADSSKFGRNSVFQIAPLAGVHQIITDAGISSELAQRLKELGIQVIIAQQ